MKKAAAFLNGLKALIRGKNSVLRYFLLSYIIVLLLPIIVTFYLYFNSLDKFTEEINNANEANLSLIKNTVDSRFREAQNLYRRIALDKHIVKLAALKNELSDQNRYTMKEIIESLEVYTVSNEVISGFYIYYKNLDLIISNRVLTDAETLYRTQEIEEIDYPVFKSLLNKTSYGELTSFNDSAISYIQSIPMTERGEPLGTVVVNVDTEKLKSQLTSLKLADGGTILVIGKDNEILFNTTPELKIENDYLNSKKYDETETYKSGSYMVTKMKSEFSDVYYVSVIPVGVFNKSVNSMKSIAVISFSVCMIIGIAMVLVFTIKSYDPIDEILRMFHKKQDNNECASTNEYNLIKSLISRIINEKDEVLEEKEKQREVLKYSFLNRLIKGKIITNIEVLDALDSYEINFESNHFATILFYLEDYSRLFHEENIGDEKKSLELVHFIMKNVVEELISSKYAGFLVEVDEFLVGLVNLDGNDYENNMLDIAREAKEFIENNFGIKFSIAISSIHNGFSELPECYRECCETIEYKQLVSAEEIILYNNIKNTGESDNPVSATLEQQQKFMNCMKASDYFAAGNIISNMISVDLNPALQLDIIKCRMFSIINLMLNATTVISMNFDSNFFEELNASEKLLSCQNPKELSECISLIMQALSDNEKQKRKKKGEMIGEEIVKYIEENYSKFDLSVSLLADYFDVSVPYLSKYFRKQYQIGLLDYIHRVRISKSKIFLKQANLSIKDISEKVGYTDSDAFIRVFKKYEGLPPGRYREQLI